MTCRSSPCVRGCVRSSAISRSSSALESIENSASLKIRVLRLQPSPCPAADVTRTDALAHDAFETHTEDEEEFRQMSHDFEARIRDSFAKQGLMGTLGASMTDLSRGAVTISLVPKPTISQQHGFVHAGAVAAIADTAAGYAALSLMPLGVGVLTTEFKINLVAPATGDRIVARARVVKAGRMLTLAQTDVVAVADGKEKLIALLTATLMTIEGRDGLTD